MSTITGHPEIIAPGTSPQDQLRQRLHGAGGVFRDENLDMLSKLLDTWFKIPGTSIRFGLDGIIGFVPGIGDLLAGAASCMIVIAAYIRGVPMITVARMVANLAIEVVVGMVPFVGNLFDIGWRANRRNYHLLERSLTLGRRDTWKDWLFVAALATGLIAMAMLPFLLLLWLGGAMLRGMRAPGW